MSMGTPGAMTAPLYAFGRIVKAFGLKGEVVVQSMTSSPSRFKKLGHVFVGPTETEAEASEVEYVSVEPRGVRVKLGSVHNRTEAERLVGCYVFVNKKDRVQPTKGTFFVDDIVGLEAVDESGHPVGNVKDVMKLPAQDVYVIERNGREILVPAIREFIREIDLHAGKITVRLIDGFLEDED